MKVQTRVKQYQIYNRCCQPELACCGDITIKDIQALLYDMKYAVSEKSEKWINHLCYGYGDCNAVEDINKLRIYRKTVENYYRQLLTSSTPCLTCREFEEMYSEILDITNSCTIIKGLDLKVDKTARPAWIQSNPYCVNKEAWEKLAYHVCDTIDITITSTDIVDVTCDLVFDIKTQVIDCTALAVFSMYSQVCDLGLTLNITEEDCTAGYGLVVRRYNCEMDFKTYMKVVDCGMSPKMIATLYECGLKVSVDAVNECPVVVTAKSTAYSLCNIDFKRLFMETTCEQLSAELDFDPSLCKNLNMVYKQLYSAYNDNIAFNLKILPPNC